MIYERVKINNEVGFRKRPGVYFVQKVNTYNNCNIYVEKNGKRVDAKSIIELLSLGIIGGDEFIIVCDGENEEQILNELIEFVK